MGGVSPGGAAMIRGVGQGRGLEMSRYVGWTAIGSVDDAFLDKAAAWKDDS